MTKEEQAVHAKTLLANPSFLALLDILALKINSLDTVRSIPIDGNLKDIGTKQLSCKLAILVLEEWLGDILELTDFYKLSQRVAENEDNVITRLKEEAAKISEY